MPIELKITLDDTGQISLAGPLDNKLICYGLLELAKEAVQKIHDQAQRRVHLAPATAVPLGPNGTR